MFRRPAKNGAKKKQPPAAVTDTKGRERDPGPSCFDITGSVSQLLAPRRLVVLPEPAHVPDTKMRGAWALMPQAAIIRGHYFSDALGTFDEPKEFPGAFLISARRRQTPRKTPHSIRRMAIRVTIHFASALPADECGIVAARKNGRPRESGSVRLTPGSSWRVRWNDATISSHG
jgi:hypothetical protein